MNGVPTPVKTRIRLLLIALLAMVLPLAACAKGPDQPADTGKPKTFEEGVHYIELFEPVPTAVPADKIEVVEMFWYGCPHCYRLEPHLQAWLKKLPDDVQLVRIPAALNASWSLLARAYYAAQELGILDKLHEPLFQAIHEQGRRLRSEDAVVRFVSALGFDGERFRQAMNSLAVQTKVRHATELGRRYGVDGVPALIVNGRYRVLGRGVHSYEEMFQVVDFLIDKERARRRAATADAGQGQ